MTKKSPAGYIGSPRTGCIQGQGAIPRNWKDHHCLIQAEHKGSCEVRWMQKSQRSRTATYKIFLSLIRQRHPSEVSRSPAVLSILVHLTDTPETSEARICQVGIGIQGIGRYPGREHRCQRDSKHHPSVGNGPQLRGEFQPLGEPRS